jgi:hypothetical protein
LKQKKFVKIFCEAFLNPLLGGSLERCGSMACGEIPPIEIGSGGGGVRGYGSGSWGYRGRGFGGRRSMSSKLYLFVLSHFSF